MTEVLLTVLSREIPSICFISSVDSLISPTGMSVCTDGRYFIRPIPDFLFLRESRTSSWLLPMAQTMPMPVTATVPLIVFIEVSAF